MKTIELLEKLRALNNQDIEFYNWMQANKNNDIPDFMEQYINDFMGRVSQITVLINTAFSDHRLIEISLKAIALVNDKNYKLFEILYQENYFFTGSKEPFSQWESRLLEIDELCQKPERIIVQDFSEAINLSE